MKLLKLVPALVVLLLSQNSVFAKDVKLKTQCLIQQEGQTDVRVFPCTYEYSGGNFEYVQDTQGQQLFVIYTDPQTKKVYLDIDGASRSEIQPSILTYKNSKYTCGKVANYKYCLKN